LTTLRFEQSFTYSNHKQDSNLNLYVFSTGGNQQTIRVAPPGSTIIRAASGATLTPGSKQIITVHKAGNTSHGGGTGQPQIVTLVKTSQGMTVATVSSA